MKVKTQEPEGFAEFWAEWMPVMRDSDGRPKARDAYAKHILRGVSPEDILFAARWHIHDRRQRNTLPYIQLAATWLNAERYEFEADRWRVHLAEEAQKAALRAEQLERIAARKAAERPQPIPEPTEDRAAIARRVFEKFNLQQPDILQ